MENSELARRLHLLESKVVKIDRSIIRRFNHDSERYVRVQNEKVAEFLRLVIQGRYPEICSEVLLSDLDAERKRYHEGRK
jgi:hypothetical protein